MVWASPAVNNIFAPQLVQSEKERQKVLFGGAHVGKRKNISLRNVRPQMEEEEGGGEVMVKATAIVHDSHRPGIIYLRCIGIILGTRRVMIPGRPGLA